MPIRRLGRPTRRTDALKVVVIGGGTGLSSLLRGLKRYVEPVDGLPPIEISAGILAALIGAPFFIYIMLTTASETES